MEISSDAQALIDSAGQGAMDYVNTQTGFGNRLTSGEAKGILATFKPQASQVYSPQNVQQTMTSPTPAPNYADPYGLYNYFYNSPDVVSARTDVNNLNQRISNFDTGTQTQYNYLENQPLLQGVITGQQANQARLRSGERDALSRQLMAKQAFLDTATTNANNLYQIAQSERESLRGLITQTGGKAGITYADSYENALKKATKYTQKVAQEEKKAAYKSELKAQLLAIGKSTSGKSVKQLEASLKKYNKAAVAEAKKNADLDYQIKLKSLRGGSGGGGGTSSILSSLGSTLTRGEGGYADGNKYQAAKDKAVSTGKISPADFDAQFGYLLSSSDQQKFGVASSGKPATAAQQTVANYASRMQSSGQTISNFENDIAGMNSLNYRAQNALIGTIGNSLASPLIQQYSQAKRDFINAVLRRESGAVISDSEFKNAEQQYFPQPGDSATAIQNKRKTRELVTNNFINASGSAYGGGVSDGSNDLNDILSQFGL